MNGTGGAAGRKLGPGWRVRIDAVAERRAGWRARREERRALLRLGEAIAGAGAHPCEALRAPLAEVAAHDAGIGLLHGQLDASRERDRADYAPASFWARPLVVVRGLAERGVLRDRLWRARRERAGACARLGAAAFEASAEATGPAALHAEAARAARARARAAAEREALLLQATGGAVLPPAAQVAGREAMTFGRFLALELRGRVLPRAPALAGLVAGWWVASTFTDSQLTGLLHRLGIGSGPRRVVSSETYKAMSFWLPITAAALCSYASTRLAAWVRARYAPAPPPGVARPPPPA